MRVLAKLLPTMLTLAVLLLSGNAQAELLTYEFTVSLGSSAGPDGALPFDAGDAITGTFSYDTATVARDLTDASSGSMTNVDAYYDTGVIDAPGVILAGSSSTINVRDFQNGSTNFDNFDLFTSGDTVAGTAIASDAIQQIILFGGDAFSGVGLPDSLALEDFTGSSYTLSGKLADGTYVAVSGTLSALALLTGSDGGGDAASVPELSADGLVAPLALLVGTGLLATTRKRDGIELA